MLCQKCGQPNDEPEATLDALALKLNSASAEMLNDLKHNNLTSSEKYEWYGYIRGIRDAAFDAGILNKTQCQENLILALPLLKNPNRA